MHFRYMVALHTSVHVPNCPGSDLGPRVESELEKDVRGVPLVRRLGDDEFVSDLSIGKSAESCPPPEPVSVSNRVRWSNARTSPTSRMRPTETGEPQWQPPQI
jgi:hypothetical protein